PKALMEAPEGVEETAEFTEKKARIAFDTKFAELDRTADKIAALMLEINRVQELANAADPKSKERVEHATHALNLGKQLASVRRDAAKEELDAIKRLRKEFADYDKDRVKGAERVAMLMKQRKEFEAIAPDVEGLRAKVRAEEKKV